MSPNFTGPPLSPADLYYLSVSTDIFLYGYLIVMIIGFIGNACQILTFCRKTLRRVSTGVLFLALSISDTAYLLTCFYVLLVYGFKLSDKSDLTVTCKFRHFTTYLTTNFSAWMLTLGNHSRLQRLRQHPSLSLVAGDRWVRTQFPMAAQRLCTPRTAAYAIVLAIIVDVLLHVHILTPMFVPLTPGVTSNCGASKLYPAYVQFFSDYWPTITLLTVTLMPACCMVFCLAATTVNIQTRRRRIQPTAGTSQDQRRSRFLHRQMFILMLVALLLFFFTTLPVSVFRFAISTLGVQQSFAISLLEAAIFGVITTLNYALNFYLHCLTSKLFRKEFYRWFPCSISVRFKPAQRPVNRRAIELTTQKDARPPGTITQLIGSPSNVQ